MKKIILVFLAAFPQLIFSQGVTKTNLWLTAGINFPAADAEFREENKGGFNFGLGVEHNTGKIFSIGGELNFANFPANLPANDAMRGAYALATLKLQNNLARKNEAQFYLKGGAGFGIFSNQTHGEGGGFIPLTFAFSTGAGLNFMLPLGNKVFIETSYKFLPSKQRNVNGIFLNTGFSFCVNPR